MNQIYCSVPKKKTGDDWLYKWHTHSIQFSYRLYNILFLNDSDYDILLSISCIKNDDFHHPVSLDRWEDFFSSFNLSCFSGKHRKFILLSVVNRSWLRYYDLGTWNGCSDSSQSVKKYICPVFWWYFQRSHTYFASFK